MYIYINIYFFMYSHLGYLKGVSKSIQVALNGLEAVLVLTLIILE